MKARVKGTGEIVEINETHTEIFTDVHDNAFSIDEIDFNVVERKDSNYWTRLEHQYAGMAMQGMIRTVGHNIMYKPEKIAIYAEACAHALVEKMKNQSV